MNESKKQNPISKRVGLLSALLSLIFALGASSDLCANTIEDAMDKAAGYFVQNAVKIPYGQKLYISKIVNLNSQEEDRLGREIESELYFALERKSPDYKLQLGESAGKRGDVYITGTYEPSGGNVEVKLRVIQQDTNPLILAQYEVEFKQETTTNRVLVAILDLEATMLDDSPKKAFSEIFRATLSQKNAFDIVNSAEIDKLDPAAVQAASGCTRDECATIIGEQLGVDRVISTSLFQVNDRVYVLSGKIINIVDGAIIRSRTVKHDGDLSTLDVSIETLASKLTDGDVKTTPPKVEETPGNEIRAAIAKNIRESQQEDEWDWDPKPKKEEKKEDELTSKEHRRESFLFVGATPYSLYDPSVNGMPYSAGLYLGSNLMLGVEQFSKDYESGTATAKAIGQSAFIRFFSGNSYNMKLAYHQRTIESTATVNTTTMTEKDTRDYISFGIGNQWITDSGITLGGDWVFYAKSTDDRTVTNSNNGGSDTVATRAAINDLKSDIDIYDFGLGLVTFTIGFTF